jgi:hypothetical protein
MGILSGVRRPAPQVIRKFGRDPMEHASPSTMADKARTTRHEGSRALDGNVCDHVHPVRLQQGFTSGETLDLTHVRLCVMA